jgi:ribokinase
VSSGGAVLVIGSINTDLVFADLDALPHPGQTVRARELLRLHGGKGANQAVAARRLGMPTLLVSAVGDDPEGVAALADLRSEGIDVRFVRRSARATGSAAVHVTVAGENSIVVAAGANDDVTSEAIAAAGQLVAGRRVVLLASLEIPPAIVEAWALAGRERGWTIVLNPAPVPADGLARDLLALVDLLTPNESELAALCERNPAALLEHGVGAVVVTLGARGAEIHARGARPSQHTPPPTDALDSTGAGDAFNAALAVSLAAGKALDEAVRIGVVAGALATRKLGARGSLAQQADLELS